MRMQGEDVEIFDVAVVGGGTAGMTAAQVARANGRRVVMIEQARIGGECTWTGCVPSKALIRAARLRHDIERAADFGLRVGAVQVDFAAVMASVHEAVASIARFEDAGHMEARGVSVRTGHACLTSRTTIAVNGDQIHAERIILCTGSRPAIPQIEGLNQVPYLTNENLFELTRLPSHLLVLGAGSTGLEMGQAFRRLGSEVTILEAEQTLLPGEDADIAAGARRLLAAEGVRLMLGAQVERVSAGTGTGTITMNALHGGRQRTIQGDTLLIATGRRPNTENLGLDEVGVRLSRQGIVVNRQLETTAAGIFAAGDVTGLYPFTHVAAYQARIAANNASGKRAKADYRVVPRVIFTEPEIASAGLTEAEARGRYGEEIRVVRLPYTAIDRAVIERQPRGLIKLIVGKKPLLGYALGEGEVIGVQLTGPQAGELLHEFVISMQARTFSGRLAQAIHAYPTMSMGVQQAAGLLFPTGRANIDLREDLDPPSQLDRANSNLEE